MTLMDGYLIRRHIQTFWSLNCLDKNAVSACISYNYPLNRFKNYNKEKDNIVKVLELIDKVYYEY